MTPEGIFMSSTVSPCAQSRGSRRILGFLTAALLVFGLGSASFADGGAPTLRVTLTPNARTVKTGDNVVYTVEFSCASTDANCDGAVLTVDVPRFSSPDGAVNSEAAPILAAASTTGVVAPPTIVAPHAELRRKGRLYPGNGARLHRGPGDDHGQAAARAHAQGSDDRPRSVLRRKIRDAGEREGVHGGRGASRPVDTQIRARRPARQGSRAACTLHASYAAALLAPRRFSVVQPIEIDSQ